LGRGEGRERLPDRLRQLALGLLHFHVGDVPADDAEVRATISMRFSVKRRGGPPPAWASRTSGAYRFNASGMFAADTTEITQENAATGRYRAISIGRDFYSQD